VLDEEPGHIHMSLEGRPMQRSRPIIVLGCRIGAVLNEEPGQIQTTPLGLSFHPPPRPSSPITIATAFTLLLPHLAQFTHRLPYVLV
jgi:hypothetical protein